MVHESFQHNKPILKILIDFKIFRGLKKKVFKKKIPGQEEASIGNLTSLLLSKLTALYRSINSFRFSINAKSSAIFVSKTTSAPNCLK